MTQHQTIDCSNNIDWTTLTAKAKTCLKTGKTLNDGISFIRFSEDTLQVNTDDIDIEAFKTAIADIDVAEDFKKANFKILREKRDKLLSETDWLALSDVTMSDAWKTYRQQLRDLPANTADPSKPTYPTKPN